jgi:hypothetical protein
LYADIVILFTEVEQSAQALMNLPKMTIGTGSAYHFEPRATLVHQMLEKAQDEYSVATNSFTGRRNMLRTKSAREQGDMYKRHSALKASIAAIKKENDGLETELLKRFEALKSATKTKRGGQSRKMACSS